MSNKKLYIRIPKDSVFTGNNILDQRRLSFNMSVAKGRFILAILTDIELLWVDGVLTAWQVDHINQVYKEIVGGNTGP